jgi:hypothetical protein
MQAQQLINKLLYQSKISFKEYTQLKKNLLDPSFFLHFVTAMLTD